MGFDPCNRSLKIWESNSQNGSSLGNMEVHSLSLSHTLGNMKRESQASLLARTFASLCLGHEPKARVAIVDISIVKDKYVFAFNFKELGEFKRQEVHIILDDDMLSFWGLYKLSDMQWVLVKVKT